MRLIDANQIDFTIVPIAPVLKGEKVHYETVAFAKQISEIPKIKAITIEVLQEIRQEIESNMESIIGKYDSSTPKRDMPSAKIERNESRQECLDIIDTHISAWSGNENNMKDRNCENCEHHKPKTLKEGCAYAWGCEIWDCKLEPTEPDTGGSECGR